MGRISEADKENIKLSERIMTDYEILYVPWRIKDSYFNRMLHCGSRYNTWVENALHYIPPDILNEYKENLAFVSTGQNDACRVARALCEQREIIVLSERILPKAGVNEANSVVRYFTFVVLHEVAHVVKRHRSPLLDNLMPEEFCAQEKEADELALSWYNTYIEAKANPNLPILTKEELEKAKAKSRKLMEAAYQGRTC
jgi:hypothetical protein